MLNIRDSKLTLVAWAIAPCMGLSACGGSTDSTPSASSSSAPVSASAPGSASAPAATPTAAFAPDNANQIPDSSLATVTVTVTSPSSATPVSPNFIGLSWEKSVLYSPLFHVTNPQDGGNNLYKLLNSLSLQGNFRIGANSLSYATWDPNGPGGDGDKIGDIQNRGPLVNGQPSVGGKIAPSDIDALAQMIHKTGWNVTYAVPGSYNFFMSDSNAKTFTSPSYANDIAADVQEANYAAGAMGSSLYGIAIGNEPDHQGLQASYYIPDWLNYVSAINTSRTGSLAPLKFVGPEASGLNSSLIQAVLSDPTAGPLVSQITSHSYLGSGQSTSSTISSMLAGACSTSLQSTWQSLEQESKQLPTIDGWRIDETNSFYSGGRAGVSDSHAASLWALQYMFCVAQQGARGINFHVQDDTNPEQLDSNLNGTFDNAYTPIQIAAGQVTKVMPVFYGMKFFSLALQADTNSQGASVLAPQSVNVSVPDGLGVVAFAAVPNRDPSASTQSPAEVEAIVVINKDSAQSIKAVINPGVSSSSADYIRLTSGVVSPTGTTAGLQGLQNSVLNNQPINVDGSWKPESYAPLVPDRDGNYTVKVPAASAVLLRLR
ncbi:hypothetical protein [Paraburkholderia metrosideri]|uniref:Beta-glucuronidase C-terminal domain-containing protein n=1 Tax=Paraburkholderia metrosideri TaxID=580937 RepID=A0ABN7HNT5_9BURK|nr:hypothetical protein [Paraburkholderia metrosideri]CAD6528812.1 hypothetical protein LMG28140_02194 [Paraburkholderia metrosideri]